MRYSVNKERDFSQINYIIARVEEILSPLNVEPKINIGNYSVCVKFRFDGMIKVCTIYYNSVDLDINRLSKRVNNEFLPLVKFNKSLPYMNALSKHELRYSANKERVFKEFKNNLTELIIDKVNDVLNSSIVEYVGIELYDNCIRVIMRYKGKLCWANIFFDTMEQNLSFFENRIKEFDEKHI